MQKYLRSNEYCFWILKYFLCKVMVDLLDIFNLFESINKKNDHNKAYIMSQFIIMNF